MPRFKRSALLVVALATAPVVGQAQDTGDGFMFGAPKGSLTIRGGWAVARAQSDFFAFTTDLLTLDRGDFSSPTIEGDLAIHISSRTAIVLSTGLSGVDRHSDFRDFIDNSGQPIEQTTTFRRVPITIGVKQYLTSTGRSVGRLAWIPSKVAPYVGAGAGAMYYKFRQEGDFINFENNNVFSSLYSSDGMARIAHAAVGVDFSVGPRLALTSEARYLWSSARLSSDFSGFERLDLSGLSTTVGLAIRF